jgi:Fe-S cluster assembly iron-binding protein IscA
MTDTAADVVQKIVEQTVSEEEQAGLRISQAADESLALTPAAASEPGDKVVEEKGARVFLDEGAAIVLEDKILDAKVEADGSVQFAVGVQD